MIILTIIIIVFSVKTIVVFLRLNQHREQQLKRKRADLAVCFLR